MRVILTREQEEQKGVFGARKGVLFVLKCRVELTPDEQGLVERASAEEQWVPMSSVGKSRVPDLRVGELMRGVRYEATDLNQMLNDQAALLLMCEHFKRMLAFIKSIGAEESVEL